MARHRLIHGVVEDLCHKVMQRTLSKDEVDFLVWMLGQYLWMDVPGATSAKDALIQACDRSWAQALGR